MNFILFVLLCLSVFFSACQENVSGCMHPRAINFDPEADESTDCDFYELVLEMQHYTSSSANDTMLLGDTLYDALDTAFVLNSCSILCSKATLIQTSQSTSMRGAEFLSLTRTDGTTVQVEDNFFVISPEIYSYNISEWKELGSFDSVRFYIGLNPLIENADPTSVTEQNHPLSSTSIPYLYAADSANYLSLNIGLSLYDSTFVKQIKMVDYVAITLPFSGAVLDGENTRLKLRLNYDILFDNVSVYNDTEAEIQLKLLQNISNAISTF